MQAFGTDTPSCSTDHPVILLGLAAKYGFAVLFKSTVFVDLIDGIDLKMYSRLQPDIGFFHANESSKTCTGSLGL
jgi:hypothetical protein